MIYRVSTNRIKTLTAVSAESDKLITKKSQKGKGSTTAKTIVRKNNKGEGLTFPDLKTYYQVTAIEIVWHWNKDKRMNRRELKTHKETNICFNQFSARVKRPLIWKEESL